MDGPSVPRSGDQPRPGDPADPRPGGDPSGGRPRSRAVPRALPAGRYGRRATRTPRWVLPVLVTLVALAGLGVAAVAYHNLGDASLTGSQTSFAVLDDGSVRISFEVTRTDPGRAADCIVRARARDGDEVGRKEVYVPPGPAASSLTTVLRTSRRPVTGEVYGCSFTIPPYLLPG